MGRACVRCEKEKKCVQNLVVKTEEKKSTLKTLAWMGPKYLNGS